MLSYDTNQTDTLLSKAPADMPRELIASGSKHTSSTRRGGITVATKVPEDAGMAALEQPRSVNEELVKITSENLLRGMPDVLHGPYRVNISSTELETSRKPEQWVGEPMAMSRMEYIQYVRAQCEKELSYVPQRVIEPRMLSLEKIEEESHLSEDVEKEVTYTKDIEEEKASEAFVTKLPLVSKENLEEEMFEQAKEESGKSHFLRVLWIRSIIAMCFFIGVVSFDLLNVHFGSVGVQDVKNVVANNHTIQKIEQIVSDFAENTVFPVFGINKEDGQ